MVSGSEVQPFQVWRNQSGSSQNREMCFQLIWRFTDDKAPSSIDSWLSSGQQSQELPPWEGKGFFLFCFSLLYSTYMIYVYICDIYTHQGVGGGGGGKEEDVVPGKF